jgi:hypothetical protein
MPSRVLMVPSFSGGSTLGGRQLQEATDLPCRESPCLSTLALEASPVKVIDDTQTDLERLIAADFGLSLTGDYQADFVNWIHFRARRVPRLPRRVFVSHEVKLHQLKYPAIEQIRVALQTGGDIGPWLSEKTQKDKANHRADMMFNDWQVLHFHLGRFFQSPTTIRRTGPLLFVHITAEEATLLDVQPHGSWTMTALLEILLRTNPPGLERYEGRGVTPMRLTDDQYKNLRANGANAAIEVAGRAFMPGGGRLSSGHAMRLYFYRDWFFRMIEKLQNELGADVVEPHLRSAIYAHLGVPVRLGAYYDDRGMAILDKNRNGLVLHQMKSLE